MMLSDLECLRKSYSVILKDFSVQQMLFHLEKPFENT